MTKDTCINTIGLSQIKCLFHSCIFFHLFLGVSFLDMLPDIIEEFYVNSHLKELQTKYPIAEFIICLGVILVMFIEKTVSFVQVLKSVDRTSDNKKQSNSKGDSVKSTYV